MTIKEAYEKIKNSPELKNKAIEAAKNDKLEEFLKENDFDITVNQIKDYFSNSKNNGELSREELDMASGGCQVVMDDCSKNTAWSVMSLGIGCAVSAGLNNGGKDVVCDGVNI